MGGNSINHMWILWLLLLTLNKIISLGGYRNDDPIQHQLDEYLKEDVGDRSQSLTQHKITEIHFSDLCPPPPSTVADEDCHRPVCTSHANCTGVREACCSNGCILTCIPDVIPSYDEIDWDLEANTTLAEPISKIEDELELKCGTASGFVSPPCPEGYTCQISEYGTSSVPKIAYSGVCISLKELGHDGLGLYTDETARDWDHLEPSTVKESVYLPGGCFLTSEQYSDIENFIKGRHFTSCRCTAGTVLCSVPPNLNSTLH